MAITINRTPNLVNYGDAMAKAFQAAEQRAVDANYGQYLVAVQQMRNNYALGQASNINQATSIKNNYALQQKQAELDAARFKQDQKVTDWNINNYNQAQQQEANAAKADYLRNFLNFGGLSAY